MIDTTETHSFEAIEEGLRDFAQDERDKIKAKHAIAEKMKAIRAEIEFAEELRKEALDCTVSRAAMARVEMAISNAQEELVLLHFEYALVNDTIIPVQF